MDLIRHTIEGLIYDFPIEVMANQIIEKREDNIRDILIDIIKRKAPEFTKTDIWLLYEIIGKEWSQSESLNISDRNHDFCQRFPLLLLEFSQNILSPSITKNPLVKFNDLLRWRALTLLVGEDILIIPFFARNDVLLRNKRELFLWSPVSDHDNFRLNSILNEELSDTHCHINASTDVFEFNWLSMMNRPRYIHKDIESCWKGGSRKEYDIVNFPSNFTFTLEEWTIVAAAIRVLLFSEISGKDCGITKKNITLMIKGKDELYSVLNMLNSILPILQENSLETENKVKLDYAIEKSDFKNDIPNSPWMIHHGERKFLYGWFRAYFGGEVNVKGNADLMLLYILIKNKIRREFIQTNYLSGFANFQEYDHEKSAYSNFAENKVDNCLRELMYRYAVQSSFSGSGLFHLEARVTPKSIDRIRKYNFRRAIFGNQDFLNKSSENNVTLIAHFIKKNEKAISSLQPRHNNLRRELIRQFRDILERNQEYTTGSHPRLVGIDAAGSEIGCPPEVFSPFFRYAKIKGISNLTYHVGEDFYDIIDGLRSIDEVVNFMEYTAGCRIGHGLALGLNPHQFYEERHNTIIIPRQTLLDNLVWIKYTAARNNIQLNPSTILFIEEQFYELIRELGYDSALSDQNKNSFVSMHDYYLSMTMRGDYIFGMDDYDVENYLWVNSSISKRDKASVYVLNLWRHYEYSDECKRKGIEVQTMSIPSSLAEDVGNIQECMLCTLENKGIVIETNPSSNIKIGRFHRYINHPIFRFHSISNSDRNHSF